MISKYKIWVQNIFSFIKKCVFCFSLKYIADLLLFGSHFIVSPVICLLPLVQIKFGSFDRIEKEEYNVCLASLYTSRDPSPKILVRMGVESMVRMVKITATPSVVMKRSED